MKNERKFDTLSRENRRGQTMTDVSLLSDVLLYSQIVYSTRITELEVLVPVIHTVAV
jgi:hypothetical protein